MDPYSPPARFAGLVLRTAHLFAMAVFVGGVWLAAPAEAVAPWRTAAVGTGVLLLASEVSHDPRRWLWQLAGLAVVAHVLSLGLVAVDGRLATALAVVVGAAGSHAPKRIRKWSIRGGGAKGDADR